MTINVTSYGKQPLYPKGTVLMFAILYPADIKKIRQSMAAVVMAYNGDTANQQRTLYNSAAFKVSPFEYDLRPVIYGGAEADVPNADGRPYSEIFYLLMQESVRFGAVAGYMTTVIGQGHNTTGPIYMKSDGSHHSPFDKDLTHDEKMIRLVTQRINLSMKSGTGAQAYPRSDYRLGDDLPTTVDIWQNWSNERYAPQIPIIGTI